MRELCAFSIIITALVVFVVVTSATNVKQGLCIATKKAICSDMHLLTSPSWAYNWQRTSSWSPSKLNCQPTPIVEYVPMIFSYTAGEEFTSDMIEPGAKYLLGYNEPNRLAQGNISAALAVEGWKKIQAVWGETHTLVSPSAVNCGAVSGKCIPDHPSHTEWFDEFFRLCAGTCDIEYLATHTYKVNAIQTKNFLQALYDLYELPIWLTEFALQSGTAAEHKAYMEEMLPWLDASPIVFRYAWFSTRHGDTNTLMRLADLDDDPKVSHLTALGTAYNNHADVSQSESPPPPHPWSWTWMMQNDSWEIVTYFIVVLVAANLFCFLCRQTYKCVAESKTVVRVIFNMWRKNANVNRAGKEHCVYESVDGAGSGVASDSVDSLDSEV